MVERLKKAWAKWKALIKRVFAAVVVLAVVFMLGLVASGEYELQWPISESQDQSGQDAEGKRELPLEFLFIDVDRVGAYLAQLKGGSYAKRHLSQKVVKAVGGGLELQGALKLESSTQEESFVENEVAPTAASSYVELEEELKEHNGLDGGFPHAFHQHIEPEPDGKSEAGRLEDGDMVRFRALVRGPVYLDPYLAVHRAATLSAIFPTGTRDRAQRKWMMTQREAARKFEKQVGKNPRMVLSIQPAQESGRRNVKYLLPIHMKQLNDERSLLRSGGQFTVVGKVVRVFATHQPAVPGDRANRRYSYVDSPTRQTWRHALRGAPKELVCRASPACSVVAERRRGRRGRARQRSIERARRHMLEALRTETRIERAGALILPVAIYR